MEKVNVDSLSSEDLDAMIEKTSGEIFAKDDVMQKPEEVSQDSETSQEDSLKKEEENTEELAEDLNFAEVEKKPEFIDKKKDPITGLKKEIVAERERRRQAELKLKELEGRLAERKEMPQNKEETADEFAEYEDDDVVPIKIVKEIARKQKELEKNLLQKEAERIHQEEMQRNRIRKEEEDAVRSKYSAEKVGQAYCYNTILEEEIIPMLEENPEIVKTLQSSAKPAELAYRLALARRMPVENILSPKPAAERRPSPKTIGALPAGGGGAGELSISALKDMDVSTLSDEQFEQALRKAG